MILILSYTEYEQCTDPVIDWLLYFNAKFIKLTIEDLYKNNNVKFDINRDKVFYKDIDLVDNVNVIFYRRFVKNINIDLENHKFCKQLQSELQYEVEYLTKYFFYILKDKLWVPNPMNSDIDKLTALSIAKECGLKTPNTIITQSKKEAEEFVNKYDSIIKPIHFSGYYISQETTYGIFTNSITLTDLAKIETPFFFPTLLQNKICKNFEIRIFFIGDLFYPTAIIVEDSNYDDVKRNYGMANINWIPYTLPNDIKEKLIKFSNLTKINTGSIDMMKDKSGDFVFIEINPVGQFIAPSSRCNYNVEKIISEFLIKNDK